MVRTIKRASADGRWKVVSLRDLSPAADVESTPAEFTCSRGTPGKSIPLQNEWRGIRFMLFRQTRIVIRSSRVTSWRTGCQIAVRIAEQ